MKNQTPTNRIFSVNEANATLPLVRSIVKDIVELSTRVSRTRQRLAFLQANRENDIPGFDFYKEETEAIAVTVADDEQRLANCIRELSELGIEINHLKEGLIDFPAERNGEKVFLSWQYGESTVNHWRIPRAAKMQDSAEHRDHPDDSEFPNSSDRIPLDYYFADDNSDQDCNLN